ncbi:acetyl-CoA synthetase-like protein [Atractiella rhizophila]|nr:acetyl-CoA synthetase-like protein [Atractiella rhizophila]
MTRGASYTNGVYTSSIFQPLADIQDCNVYNFVFDYHCPLRPLHHMATPLLRNYETTEWQSKEDLKKRTDSFARLFVKDYTVGEDEVVFVYAENSIDYGAVVWGTHRINAILSPANPSLTPTELSTLLKLVLKHYKVKCMVVTPSSLASARQSLKLAGLNERTLLLLDDDLNRKLEYSQSTPLPPILNLKKGGWSRKVAFLAFSSGTTGLPKVVVIPHTAVNANVLQVRQSLRSFDPTKHVILGAIPFYHAFAMVMLLHHCVFIGMPIIVLPRFNFEHMLDAIQKYQVTHAFLVPPQLVLLAKHPLVSNYDLSSLHTILCGAAPVSKAVADQFKIRLPHAEVYIGLGTTETFCYVSGADLSTSPPPKSNLNSVGHVVPSMKIKIVDPETKRLCPPGERGEICILSPSNALGYLGNDEATKSTFDADGYVHTGDEGYFGKRDGELYITDRIKELIKTKGNQVAPAELEGHILDHEAVADVCVIGIPDEYAGELPRAYVVLSPAAQQLAASSLSKAEELKQSVQKFVASRLIRYKWLDGGVEFIDTIPKTPSGKIQRRYLREKAKKDGLKAKL